MRPIALGDTFRFLFSTRRFSTGASYTLAGTPAIHVYEDDNLTQITAGITLAADYDSITGLNEVEIAATAANGYEAGKWYTATIGAGTVDSVSVVGTVVYEFRIESVVERAVRLIQQALYPSGVEITATTTSNSTTAINLTDVVDAQTPDDALVGLVLIVWDATDGRIEIVETTACSSKVATVRQVSDGGAMSFTVAVGDYVIINGASPQHGTARALMANTLTEDYASDGTAATTAELLYMIQALLSEFSVSGTTLTAKKIDGSTTAGTFTLSDATNPTSITRAS